MRKKNNMHRRSGGQGGRRYHGGGGGGGGGRNDGQNIARQKHHATQMREKYTNLARDAQNNGDRVDVEYYLQHVDHYTRVLTDIAVIEAERFAQQREQQQAQGGESNDGGDQGGSSGGDTGGNDEPITTGGNQPRMTRHPRHRGQHTQQDDPNGSKAANANTEEIPLPGGILPAI